MMDGSVVQIDSYGMQPHGRDRHRRELVDVDDLAGKLVIEQDDDRPGDVGHRAYEAVANHRQPVLGHRLPAHPVAMIEDHEAGLPANSATTSSLNRRQDSSAAG